MLGVRISSYAFWGNTIQPTALTWHLEFLPLVSTSLEHWRYSQLSMESVSLLASLIQDIAQGSYLNSWVGSILGSSVYASPFQRKLTHQRWSLAKIGLYWGWSFTIFQKAVYLLLVSVWGVTQKLATVFRKNTMVTVIWSWVSNHTYTVKFSDCHGQYWSNVALHQSPKCLVIPPSPLKHLQVLFSGIFVVRCSLWWRKPANLRSNVIFSNGN